MGGFMGYQYLRVVDGVAGSHPIIVYHTAKYAEKLRTFFSTTTTNGPNRARPCSRLYEDGSDRNAQQRSQIMCLADDIIKGTPIQMICVN